MIKRVIFNALLFILLFTGAALSFNYIQNNKRSSRAVEGYNPTMEKAYMMYDGMQINSMLGYTTAIDTSLYRDSIVPLDSSKTVNVLLPESVDSGADIKYELRSFDGTNLIEEGDFRFVSTDEGISQYTASLRMDLTLGTEYSFVIRADNSSRKCYFYTRVVRLDNTFATKLINYAKTFSDEAYEENKRINDYASGSDAVATYNVSGTLADLNNQTGESEENVQIATTTDAMSGVNEADLSTVFGSADAMNTNYDAESASEIKSDGNPGFVTLNSSYEDVIYNGMNIERLSDPVPKLKEVTEDSAVVELKYKAISVEENEAKTFAVSEYFSLEYDNGAASIVLNDYKRYVNQDFNSEGIDFLSGSVCLGVTSESSPDYISDESCKRIAFVADNSLWLYNNSDDTYSSVYGTSSDEAEKERTPQEGFGIRLISIDDEILDFIVYGRINEGPREGESGVALYEYSIKDASLKEITFVTVNLSLSALKFSTGKFSYYDRKNRTFYTLLSDKLISVDVFSGKTEEIISDIPAEQVLVSDDMRVIAYPDKRKPEEVTKITIRDFGKDIISEKKESGQRLSILGFVGSDILYGAARDEDITQYVDKTPIFNFDKLFIVKSNGKVIKSYEKEGVLVSGVTFKQNTVYLDRVSKNEETGGLSEMQGDYISYKPAETTDTMRVVVTPNENGNNEVYLKFPDRIYVSSGNEELFTKIVSNSNEATIEYKGVSVDKRAAYIYEAQGLVAITSSVGKAVRKVYDDGGYVVNANGAILYRDKISRAYYTVAGTFEYKQVDDEADTFAACNYMCVLAAGLSGNYDDIRAKGSWEESFEMYSDTVRGINLSGVKMDTAIGYLADGCPFAAKIENKFVLVVSFNDDYIRYYDPIEGKEEKVLRYRFQMKCNENDNEFYTFVK